MAKVYVVRQDGNTEAMKRVLCRDEDAELQRILEKNPDLLPGEQIDPEDPCRWLLVKREMPVPDPNTGAGRWSIDFFFVDQAAIPTFVECKRFTDTRSRREIVGQMLEYAANGHYYWSKEEISTFAEQSQKKIGLTLQQAFEALQTEDESLEGFLSRVQDNLREGKLRIIFFLEESPLELRSVVDFLNKQMELSWVLLVEARQYTQGGITVVVPTLFGYTEEARRAKRSFAVNSSGAPRRKWDIDSFFEDAKGRLGQSEVQALRMLYDESAALGFEFSWGTGITKGSFNIRQPAICPRSLLTASSNGDLSVNFSWLKGSESADAGKERLRDVLAQMDVFPIPADYATRWLVYPASDWTPKVARLVQALKLFGNGHA
jgi:hypothetical protein